MALTLDDFIGSIHKSRKHFLKHVHGLSDEQLDWKTYAECKSIRETVAHLICDDRAALQALQTGGEPDYESLQESERDWHKLLATLETSHSELCAYLARTLAGKPLDDEVCIFGGKYKMAIGIPYISSEDFYHAGQVAFIRMATDPSWDYYSAIYAE